MKKYKISRASGKDLDISWGNFTKRESFTIGERIFSIEDIENRLDSPKIKKYNYDKKTGEYYIYGFPGITACEIYEKILAWHKNNNSVIRILDQDSFQLGSWKYTIEIKSFEDIQRLIMEFGRIIISCSEIIIYDSYIE